VEGFKLFHIIDVALDPESRYAIMHVIDSATLLVSCSQKGVMIHVQGVDISEAFPQKMRYSNFNNNYFSLETTITSEISNTAN
jgi:hypothetical protein